MLSSARVVMLDIENDMGIEVFTSMVENVGMSYQTENSTIIQL